MTKTRRLEKEAEESSEVSERGKLRALYKKYKYIWAVAYVVVLIVLFSYMKMAGKPGIVGFLFFVITFGLIAAYVHRKIGRSYQKERQIITKGKEDLYPFV